MDASSILSHYQSLVRPKVESYLQDPPYPNQFTIPNQYQPLVDFHWKVTSDYPLRQSKYLRPTLIALVAESMGIDINQVLPTAAAMQLSEEWILIHDDLEDDSLLRRGKPTLHKLHSIPLAVNIGDGLQVLMWSALFENFPILGEPTSLKILNEFRTILTRTVIGQTTEIKWMEENKLDLSDDDWFFVSNSKTSYYTIAGPLRLGGIIAKANPHQLDGLSNLGNPLGFCFQLVDDILDLTSNFDGRKEQYGDIYEGKRTIMLGHLLRHIDHHNRQQLINILNKSRQQKSLDEVKWVVEQMHSLGSIEYAQKLAEKFKNETIKTISQLDFLTHNPAREYLETLANFILTRNH